MGCSAKSINNNRIMSPEASQRRIKENKKYVGIRRGDRDGGSVWDN